MGNFVYLQNKPMKAYYFAAALFIAACTSTEEPSNDKPIENPNKIVPDSLPGEPQPSPDSTLNKDTMAQKKKEPLKFSPPMIVKEDKEILMEPMERLATRGHDQLEGDPGNWRPEDVKVSNMEPEGPPP